MHCSSVGQMTGLHGKCYDHLIHIGYDNEPEQVFITPISVHISDQVLLRIMTCSEVLHNIMP